MLRIQSRRVAPGAQRDRARPGGARALRRARRRDAAARRRARRGRARLGRRRPRVRRLRRRARLREPRPQPARGRRRGARAGRPVHAPVLHGRHVRAVRGRVPPARGAVAVPRRQPEVDPAEQRRRGGRERRQDRARRDRPPRRHRLRQRLPRPDAARADDDVEGGAVQARLRPVRAGGLPDAGALSVPRRLGGRRARRAEAPVQGRRRPGLGRVRPARAGAGRGRLHPDDAGLPAASAGAARPPRDPVRRRRGAERLRPHRPGLGDRALRSRAGSARERQDARRRPPARRGHRPRRGRGRRPAGRSRRHVRRQPGRVRRRGSRARRAAGPARSGGAGRAAAARAARGDGAAWRGRARPRPDAGDRAAGAIGRPDGAHNGRGARSRIDPPVLRHPRQRRPDPGAVHDRRRAARARARHPRALPAAMSGGGAGAGRVELEGVRKSYGDVVAVDGVDLAVADGEFFTLLGPSGSGKTTTLRLIAGFEQPDAGRVLLGGADITRRPPYARDVNTVFQDYALFPHMTVAENVGYGLKVKGVERKERAQRVDEVLERVRLGGFGRRKPIQLSGGQRQRVALARAIVNRPKVLLLDEPLGALDLKLRQEMQVFLKTLQRELGMTFLYVTHDQEEALTMSDHVAVFNEGRIEQAGTPTEIYERPSTEFVAGFVGTSNILERDGRRFSVRPERIAMNGSGEPGVVVDAVFVGAFTRYLVETERGERLTVVRTNDGSRVEPGTRVGLAWRADDAYEIEPQPPNPPRQEVR